ncbi:MAG TPA: PhoH family protein [Limnochordia bacterium]|nr:PhoH family protein [Limnochordia bacterium]
MKTPLRVEFALDDNQLALAVAGKREAHLRTIEAELGVSIVARGNVLSISGPEPAVAQAQEVLHWLRESAAKRQLRTHDVRSAIQLVAGGQAESLAALERDVVQTTARGQQITPRTLGQRAYVQALRANEVVFAVGPAGTGKTYLAMALAVAALKNREVDRLILTRPAVEAGESLGFLPGDLQEKVDPYLRPLYDALYDILGNDTFQRFMERGIIEVAPLAYMRGRTLDNAYIILDEAQNTTPEQMKMFLTRMGFGSRMVITGDVTQIDLPEGTVSGLVEVVKVLGGVEGIGIVELSETDVVRHELVQRIIRAYSTFEASQRGARNQKAPAKRDAR